MANYRLTMRGSTIRRTMAMFWSLLVVAGATLLLIVWGNMSAHRAAYRFRMTLEVDTPNGLVSRSSVYEVTARYRADLQPGGQKREWSVRGEAIAASLSDRRTLFALLRTNAIHEDLAGLSMTALDPAFRNDVVESAGRIARTDGVRSSAVVERALYPMLVTFRDPEDPCSVEEVDPDDLARTFGPGTRLRRITVALTDDLLSDDLSRRLGPTFWRRWGTAFAEGSRHGSAVTNPFFDTLFARLSRSDFINKATD